ncbi:MAG TPA: O-antigen ligase family protein [Mucilaginibacter sp.]|jgi:O-antigen ligase|nr:O-antigen ligase family protein [Mucilaginibacter sp.]
MAELFNIRDSLANKISYYHLLFLLASLPFDRFYSHLVLISYIIHTLIHLKKENIKPVFNLRMLALQSVFLVTVCSTIYSFNKPEAFNEWGKQLTILIFPLVFCLNPLDIHKYRPKLLQAFAWVCSATVIYLYIDAFITISHYQLPWSAICSGPFTNHNFAIPIDMHATFFSMQLMVALAYLISSIIKEPGTGRKLLNFFCCIVLTAGIVQLSSKSIFAVLLILVNIGVPWFLLKGSARVKFVVISLSFSVLAMAMILASSTFRERFITELKVDMSGPTVGEIHESRLARWETVIELIQKKPLTGYGAGTEPGLLHDRFYQKKMYDSFLLGLNGHSEYLSIALKSGLIGLLAYLGTLVWGFKIALRRRDLLFFNFMVLITVVCFSENLLDVDKGTFFYSLFFSFFVFSEEILPEKTVARQIPSLIGLTEAEVLV